MNASMITLTDAAADRVKQLMGGADSDVALVWAPPRDAFAKCTKLRGIIMQGQGVDHMMRDDTVPRDIPLVRLVDPDMTNALSQGLAQARRAR